MLFATCSSDLIVILRRGSLSAVTQLRVIPLCEPSFLEVLLAHGVTSCVATHAPQPLVTNLGSVSTFLSYNARGSPLGVASSWVVSVPGFPSSGVGTSRVRLPPTGTRTYGFETTFLFSSLLFWASGARDFLMVLPPSMVFPAHGYRGVTPSMS